MDGITCAECGYNNPAGVRTCNICSAKLESAATCARCGQNNPDSARFCNACGNDLSLAPGSQPPPPQAPGFVSQPLQAVPPPGARAIPSANGGNPPVAPPDMPAAPGMRMAVCPGCGRQNLPGAGACAHCGHRTGQDTQSGPSPNGHMTPAAGPNYHSVTAELNQKVQELLERLRPRLAGDLPWNLHALLSLICVVLSLFTSGGLVSAGAVLLGVVGLFHALDQEYANSWMAAVGVVGGVVITLFSALFRLIQL